MSPNRHRLVVGVDFGTTYSGLAYIHTTQPDFTNIQVIKTWPGGHNANRDKAPTEINYSSDSSEWGYQISPGDLRYGEFKLLLDKNATTTQYDNPRLAGDSATHAQIPLPAGKSALMVTADYLRHLYAHLMETLRKKLVVTLDSTPIQFVLTTPAIWSHEAQNATCEAAQMAGFTSRPGDTLSMVSEPEAAASYCIKEIFSQRKDTDSPLRIGEKIVICDAGGGTVDVITYTVEQVTPLLRLHEAVVGSGGKCGSVALDKEFLSLLKHRVRNSVDKLPARKTGRDSALMTDFDRAKWNFGEMPGTKSWRITMWKDVEDDPDNGIQNGEMKLTVEDMAKIFDPVVKQVVELVARQVEESNKIDKRNKVSTILLVGGFGESLYLFKKIQEWTRAQSYSIQVLNPSFSWSAVVRGAVLHGIESLVHARKLKQHYGIILSVPFVPGIHDESDTVPDPYYGTKYVSNNVRWLAAKGDDASVENVISLPCGASFDPGDKKLVVLTLMGCKLETPPTSAKHQDVHTLGKISCDLTNMPTSAFVTKSRGFLFWAYTGAARCSFRVDMKVGSADLELDLMYGDRSYGSATISY